MMAKTAKDNQQTFEEALAELEKIVAEVEAGEIGLEESINKYEAGMKLIKRCRVVLEQAEKRIEIINKETFGQNDPQEPPSKDGS